MCEAVVILGPTASGKSALSLELARHYRIEIISLDSALIYRDMDIGTAKPSPQEQAVCPHHLIDICDPAESYSAAAFRADCIRLVSEIRARGRLPVICGGTMMYYKALVDGLSPLPETDPEVRAQVNAMAVEKGWPTLHAMLKDIDPDTYARLAPLDKQRIARALEVYYMTGRAMSSFFSQPKEGCPFTRLEAVLLPGSNDRSELRVQIRKRFEQMLEQGLIAEVQALMDRGDLSDDMPSLRAVGYRQVMMYLRHEVSYEEMIELAVIATARLAKHQMTWLRGGLKNEPEVTRIQLAIEESPEQRLARLLDECARHPGLSSYHL